MSVRINVKQISLPEIGTACGNVAEPWTTERWATIQNQIGQPWHPAQEALAGQVSAWQVQLKDVRRVAAPHQPLDSSITDLETMWQTHLMTTKIYQV